MHALLTFSERLHVLPVIHGSGDFALAVRRVMLENKFDCVAVPLPPSFQTHVEEAVSSLPTPTVVVQKEPLWQVGLSEYDQDLLGEDPESTISYVPVDPCQPVIAALRAAVGEHIPRAFIDLETAHFRPRVAMLPDAYALKKASLHQFAAALLPALPPLPLGQSRDRVAHMAYRLRALESEFRSVLCVCSILDWPWIRAAYLESVLEKRDNDETEPTEIFAVRPETLAFVLGELPFITSIYERARAELEDDQNVSIDGIKELLVAARAAYRKEFGKRSRKMSPHLLSNCLKYIRNLTLLERRFTPDLFTIVTAAKQIAGEQFALHVMQTARHYQQVKETRFSEAQFGVDRARLSDGQIFATVNRLPGTPVTWRTLELQRRPDKEERMRWKMRWNPRAQCSWPPEDQQIENFRHHVAEKANAIIGADLVQTEKFTTSVKDGIDIRDTVRSWHTGEIYVKVLPPSKGKMDAVIMLFDSPADPRDYPWRTTWWAEHQNESTLCFFATNFQEELVGPGIGLATYGGAMFLFPPMTIFDVWRDPRLDFTETLEERLLAAACLHSDCTHIALLSHLPPGAGWRSLARRYKKKWVHVPLSQFSESTIQQLRLVHVLNGHEVRSFASHFIRKA